MTTSTMVDMKMKRDIGELFETAEAACKVGLARKTRSVDARPASAGEVIVTFIAGEGKETRSKPAEAGDMVVRNRCLETGNEEYLVSAKKFAARYQGPHGSADAEGWERVSAGSARDALFYHRRISGRLCVHSPLGRRNGRKGGGRDCQKPGGSRRHLPNRRKKLQMYLRDYSECGIDW
jgi:hypothetical protein